MGVVTTDHDMLELVAADAPTPVPGDAGATLARTHRARLRRKAAVYATAIKAVAETVSAGGPPVLVVYVMDRICAEVLVRIMDGGCDPQSLSNSVREELAAELVSYPPVRSVTDGREVTEAKIDQTTRAQWIS